MQTFEFEGKTADDAIENAIKELNISKDEMEIEVMEPGSAGIFGLVGGRKAKVKVTVGEKAPETPEKDEALDIAEKSLKTILSLIPAEGTTVHASQNDGTIVLNIEGDKSGLLIGRKGRTLDALQFIVNKIVNKTLEKKSHVVVDSENYRKRRQDTLIQMALSMSEKAKKIKKPVATNLLNPHDRRTIHLALKSDEKVETKSRGEGLLKKVVILPKK